MLGKTEIKDIQDLPNFVLDCNQTIYKTCQILCKTVIKRYTRLAKFCVRL